MQPQEQTSTSSLEDLTGKEKTQSCMATGNALCKLSRRRTPTQRGKACTKTVQQSLLSDLTFQR